MICLFGFPGLQTPAIAQTLAKQPVSFDLLVTNATIVTMDPDTSVVKSVIALQYNPDSLSRTLQIQSLPGGQDGVRVDALRLLPISDSNRDRGSASIAAVRRYFDGAPALLRTEALRVLAAPAGR